MFVTRFRPLIFPQSISIILLILSELATIRNIQRIGAVWDSAESNSTLSGTASRQTQRFLGLRHVKLNTFWDCAKLNSALSGTALAKLNSALSGAASS